MFNREKLRQLGASVIAELGHVPAAPKPQRHAGRVASGKKGVSQRKAAGSPASTSSTVDSPDDLSTSTASMSDSSEVHDNTIDFDKEISGLRLPSAAPMPLPPGLLSDSVQAREHSVPWERMPNAGPRQMQDVMVTQCQQCWAPRTPERVWSDEPHALPASSATQCSYEPTAGIPMYVRIPSLEKVCRPR